MLGAKVRARKREVGYAHFQNQDVTGGGLEGVKKAHEEGVLEVLQDAKLMSDLVTLHQLLVHKLCGHCSLGSLLVTLLNYSKSAPVKPVTKKLHGATPVGWRLDTYAQICLCWAVWKGCDAKPDIALPSNGSSISHAGTGQALGFLTPEGGERGGSRESCSHHTISTFVPWRT